MTTHQAQPTLFSPPSGGVGDHAVVVGSSITGLLAARILSEQFSHVTIVERDRLPDVPEFRRGVPQARHAHTLQPEGQLILESHFPGLVDELLASGAIAIAAGRDLVFFQGGTWRRPRPRETQVSIACSRPLLETIIHRRVAGRANVRILPGYETVGLRADERSQRVTGVRLRHRHQAAAAETVLGADLVVDAGGCQSQSPRWLHGLGYTPPEEWAVNSFVGYATRIYRRPAGLASDWKVLYVRPTPADGPRGGIILPVEGGGWHVTLIGVAGDYPPTDEAGFLAFARGLPTPRLYEAIRDAEPLTKPLGFRRTENRVRRYDRLPRYLEVFIVCGDAVYALNPIYAQGMTAAAIGGQVLARCLQARRRQPGAEGLNGLAETYQRELSEAVAGLWQMATRKDWDWPITEVTDTIFQLPTPLPPARRANATAAFHGYA